jgi:dTDP-3-amino-3,4,6-trideoxy-alpha-D-glucose transaminase
VLITETQTSIPFIDLKRQYAELEDEINAALARVLTSGAYVLGTEVEAFEREWSRFCGVRGAVGVNNGTDALALALIASGALRAGFRDEVITSTLTAGYTALSIQSAGGVPIFSDVDPQTYTLDPAALEKAITPRTRAIVPVHLYGQMADMNAICDIAKRHGLIVIEDAAQAHGAQIAGKRAGAHGDAAAFSFYPTKNLGALGDGGAVVSNDVGLLNRVKDLRQGGHPAALRAEATGRNSRLDEIQAAVLSIKLKHLEEWNRRRQDLAEEYKVFLEKSHNIVCPLARERTSHVFHLYVVQHPSRDRLLAHLAAHGVQASIHYPYLLHQQPLFRNNSQRALPVAEKLVKRILSLPLYPQLSSDELRTTASALNSF